MFRFTKLPNHTQKYFLQSLSQHLFSAENSGVRQYATSNDNNDSSNKSSGPKSPFDESTFSRRRNLFSGAGDKTSHASQQQTPSNAPVKRQNLFSRNRAPDATTKNEISQSGSKTIKMFDEQSAGRKITEHGKGDRPANTAGTGTGGIPTNAYVEQRRKPLFGRPREPFQKPPSAGSVHADLLRDDKEALRTPFGTKAAGADFGGKTPGPVSATSETTKPPQQRRSLFAKGGLFGATAPTSSAVGTDQDTTSDQTTEAPQQPRTRRPLFSTVSSPFAQRSTGPQRSERPQDVIAADPKKPVTMERGIPKTSMYGIEHDHKLKNEIQRINLMRERTRDQLQALAVRTKVGERHRFWENIDTKEMRMNVLKNYNRQRYEMLKPLLDLVQEVDSIQAESTTDSSLQDTAIQLHALDDQVNGFLNKNPKLKAVVGARLNPWTIIEDPTYARQVLTKKTLQLNGYNLLNKLDAELSQDPSAERTLKHFIDLDSVRANQEDYKAYELAARLIGTNISERDVARDEWLALKEDMARVLNLDPNDMQSQRLLTSESAFESRDLKQRPFDPLQEKAKSFVETLRQGTTREDMSALEAFKLHQEEEESLVKALRSRDKVALLTDPYGGTVIGLSNHIIVYEAQMKQIIRDHNRRLRLLREAKAKYAQQYGRVEIADTAPVVHISKIRDRQIQAPLYRYVERFVDRIPDSVAKRRLASHARVIMRNKYLTLDEKREMVGNLAQVYQKYRLHLHMENAEPRPLNTTHLHGEIRRYGA